MFLYKDTAKYLIENVPSLSQILPTYDFLNPYGKLQCEQNNWLENLNDSSSLSLLTKKDDTDPAKVRTMIFTGNNKDTVSTIQVGLKLCANPVYPDGMPLSFDRSSAGDGTVLMSSAILGSGVSYGSPKTEEHAKLVKAFACDAAAFIEGNAACSANPSLKTAAADSGNVPALSISTLGRVRPLITSTTGLKSGIENNQSVNDIPDAGVSIGMDAGGVNIENAADGAYNISLTNSYAEDYQFTVSYVDSTGANALFTAHGFNHANTTSIPFTLNSAATDKITINHTPLPPASLQADAFDSGGLKTRLSWTASADPLVTGYNIYAKYIDEPYLAQIGTFAGATFDTTDAWAVDSSVKARVYAVSAKKADGTESFLSNMAQNDDRDHDGLTDAEELALGTDPTKADTDGDGLKDGEEYLRGTNPLMKDTDGDGFSDYLEVQRGSDPLDSKSVPNAVLINNDDSYTLSPHVTLSIFASDPVSIAKVCISNTNTCNSWATFVQTKHWTLTSGDGVKTVYVRFKDKAGQQTGPYSDTIILDTKPPSGTVTINGGAYATNDPNVTLSLSVADVNGVAQMQFSDNNKWTGMPWETFAPTRAYTIPAKAGVRTVYARFRDAAGKVSAVCSDTIVYSTTSPPTATVGAVTINGGAEFTTSTAAKLTITNPTHDPAFTQMCFSTNGTKWTAWETVKALKSLTLPAGDGVKTVNVKFRDSGLNESGIYMNTIIHDTKPPVGTISVNGGAATTTDQHVTLSLSAADANGVTDMQFSTNNKWTNVPWEPFAPTKSFDLGTATPGNKSVYVRFKDAAGKISAACSDSIKLVAP